MIETKRTVTTLDGKTIELKKGGPVILELQLQAWWVDSETGFKNALGGPIATAHVTRDTLERCGRMPPVETKQAPTETPEDLLRRLLENIGVVFE